MPRRALPAFLFLAATLCAGAEAAAQTPMTADEFEAYTTGKTLYFFSRGQAYGAEEYRENRRVTWSFLDGVCKEGLWYPQDEQICFVYEDMTGPQCWTFFREPGGLRAQFEGRESGTELYEADEADEPMVCLGPDVGV